MLAGEDNCLLCLEEGGVEVPKLRRGKFRDERSLLTAVISGVDRQQPFIIMRIAYRASIQAVSGKCP